MPIKLKGATSGDITLDVPAAAGTNTLTLPAKTGNIITSADSGTVTQTMLANGVASSGPAFRAYANASQTVTSSILTKVAINTKSGANYFDTASCFDTSNNRFTPNVAGYYQINGIVRGNASSTFTIIFASLYKNGSEYGRGTQLATSLTAGTPAQVTICDVVYLNGSTDYIELWGMVSGSGTTTFDYFATSATSVLSGFLARAS